jgi:hypothetical protein
MSTVTRYEMIANQMMKGCGNKLTSKAGSDQEIDEFCKRYHKTIKYLEDTMPKTISVGVCGAVGKAILWYGMEEMQPFCERFTKRLYEGHDDPVHILRQWLILNSGRHTKETYRRTVTALRAYIRGAKYTNKCFKQAVDDLFEWEDNYTVMHQIKRNQHSSMSGQKRIPLAN